MDIAGAFTTWTACEPAISEKEGGRGAVMLHIQGWRHIAGPTCRPGSIRTRGMHTPAALETQCLGGEVGGGVGEWGGVVNL